LTHLIQFFYVLTNPEIRDLGIFLTGTHFGDFRCHVLLVCTLSFLGERNLHPRVQNSLREMWNPAREPGGLNPIRHIFGEIQNAFLPGLDAAQCVDIAFARMNGMMTYLLSTWRDRPLRSLFVNPFSKYTRAPIISLVDNPPPVDYGQISDLANFFSACCFISDWGDGCSFPPSGFRDRRFNDSGITKFVVHSWYPDFYDWVFQLDAEAGVRRQHVVVGSPGIGKSLFGLYFMARLIASRKRTFCGHPFFVLSWRLPDSLETYTFLVNLTGEVFPITSAERARYRGMDVFHLFDGHSEPGVFSGLPCLSVLLPSEMRHWKITPDIRYAPSLTIRELG
jgi:hypothetical protein